MLKGIKRLVPVFIKNLIKQLFRVSRNGLVSDGIPENWHVKFVKNLANLMQVKVYAELGIYEGETFNSISATTKIAVDIDAKYLAFAQVSSADTALLGDSAVLADYLKRNSIKIDMLFIDANHSVQAVISDFKALESFINSNGIILMHDTYPKSEYYTSQGYCGDAYLAIDSLTREFENWSFSTIPVHPGLTLATRLPNRPHWALKSKE
jgi:predicted O-methyltransferase YrrM